jgi:hypothetical protein
MGAENGEGFEAGEWSQWPQVRAYRDDPRPHLPPPAVNAKVRENGEGPVTKSKLRLSSKFWHSRFDDWGSFSPGWSTDGYKGYTVLILVISNNREYSTARMRSRKRRLTYIVRYKVKTALDRAGYDSSLIPLPS